MTAPRVSIGLPVYNSENFLAQALDSLLAQTFTDFELIVSDNASTDRTPEICQDYCRRDGRIRYVRNSENIGASANYTRVFELSQGVYFKWAAHDDIYLPRFVERCVDVLDRDPSVDLCYTSAHMIDAGGVVQAAWGDQPTFTSPDPIMRFRAGQLVSETIPIWGLMRRDVLATTLLLGNYPGHERPLLAELALRGRFHQVQEYLFRNRDHPDRSVRRFDPKNAHAAQHWHDPKLRNRWSFPPWRMLAEYLGAIRRSSLPFRDRARCYREMALWLSRQRGGLVEDVVMCAQRLPAVGPPLLAAYQRTHPMARMRAAGAWFSTG